MSPDLENLFASLQPSNYRIASEETQEYNCVAWAAAENHRWWWPIAPPFSYWPAGIEREVTLACFVKAFMALGYEQCEDDQLETGYEKVAIYVDPKGTPKHMARQIHSGQWTSKLGMLEDIEHETLEALGGTSYGRVSVILRRLRQ